MKKRIKKTNVMRLLEKENIPYETHTYTWKEDDLGAKNVADKTSTPYETIYKTLVTVGDKSDIIVTCIPSDSELDLKMLASISGHKNVDMLPMKDLEKVTGYIRGGCSPIGMKKLYPTFIDSSAETLETIIVSAGKRGLQVELNPIQLKYMIQAEFAKLTIH